MTDTSKQPDSTPTEKLSLGNVTPAESAPAVETASADTAHAAKVNADGAIADASAAASTERLQSGTAMPVQDAHRSGGFAPAPAHTMPMPVPVAAANARRPQISTIVWGLIILAFGVVLLALTLGFKIDLDLFAIAGLGVAGVVLLISAIIGSRKR